MDYGRGEKREVISKRLAIDDNFSDFDKVFYQWDEKRSTDLLLFVSTEKQLIGTLNLMDQHWSIMNLRAKSRYRNIEVYDRKIFCVDAETLAMDILFLTRKQQAYHKRRIIFANKGIKLKEEIQLIIWKHDDAGVKYRCLLGPLEDGRYMNFDLLERYFNGNLDTDVVIGNIVFIGLGYRDGNGGLDDVICTMDELRKSVICYNKRTKDFFEYNDFAGEKSRFLDTMQTIYTRSSHIKRIYSFCPYVFFPKNKKNQLQASAKNVGKKANLETFVRNLYREVWICTVEGLLLKLILLPEAVMANNNLWKFTTVDTGEAIVTDIAINDRTGKIYCLCEKEIKIFERQEQDSEIMLTVEMRKKQLLSDFFPS